MLIVSPNLGMDRVLRLPALRPGEVLRFTQARIIAGGKGVNVARVARALGAPATLVGFACGHGGQAVAGLLADEGLTCALVPGPGEARCMSIVTEDSGRVTVLNEPGPEITASDWETLEHAVQEQLPAHQVLVCIGSVPPSGPPDGYARLVRLAHAEGRRVMVDANGALLVHALAAQPDVVTPNVFEARALLGPDGGGGTAEAVEAQPVEETRRIAAEAAQGLLARGAHAAVVTAGGAGAALAIQATPGLVRWISAPRVQAVNPVGAGDAFAAGLAAALERGDVLPEAVRQAAAIAAASVETELPGQADPARAAALLDYVELLDLSAGAAGVGRD